MIAALERRQAAKIRPIDLAAAGVRVRNFPNIRLGNGTADRAELPPEREVFEVKAYLLLPFLEQLRGSRDFDFHGGRKLLG